MLKIITILLDMIVVIFSIYKLIIGEMNSIFQPIDLLGFLCFYILPVLNIITILQTTDKSHWIYLFFKTKALEEKRRIVEAKRRDKKDSTDDYC